MEIIFKIYNYLVFTFPYFFFPYSIDTYNNLMHNQLGQISLLVVLYFILYRLILHLFGAILIVLSGFELNKFHKYTDVIFFSIFMIFICFQEFYLQPKTLNQPLYKGVLDTLTWLAPMLIYYYFVHRKKK